MCVLSHIATGYQRSRTGTDPSAQESSARVVPQGRSAGCRELGERTEPIKGTNRRAFAARIARRALRELTIKWVLPDRFPGPADIVPEKQPGTVDGELLEFE